MFWQFAGLGIPFSSHTYTTTTFVNCVLVIWQIYASPQPALP